MLWATTSLHPYSLQTAFTVVTKTSLLRSSRILKRRILLGPLQYSSLMGTLRTLSLLAQPSPWSSPNNPLYTRFVVYSPPIHQMDNSPWSGILPVSLSPSHSLPEQLVAFTSLILITLFLQMIPKSISQTPASLQSCRLIYICLRKSSTQMSTAHLTCDMSV